MRPDSNVKWTYVTNINNYYLNQSKIWKIITKTTVGTKRPVTETSNR